MPENLRSHTGEDNNHSMRRATKALHKQPVPFQDRKRQKIFASTHMGLRGLKLRNHRAGHQLTALRREAGRLGFNALNAAFVP